MLLHVSLNPRSLVDSLWFSLVLGLVLFLARKSSWTWLFTNFKITFSLRKQNRHLVTVLVVVKLIAPFFLLSPTGLHHLFVVYQNHNQLPLSKLMLHNIYSVNAARHRLQFSNLPFNSVNLFSIKFRESAWSLCLVCILSILALMAESLCNMLLSFFSTALLCSA